MGGCLIRLAADSAVPWIIRFSHYPIAGYLPPSARPDHVSGRAEGEGLARRRQVAMRLTIHGTAEFCRMAE